MTWNNELTNLLSISYPIVQAPMLGVTTPQMVAAIANEGGLGSLPVGGLPAPAVRNLVQLTKTLTDKPFAVNLFANEDAAADAGQVQAMQAFLQQLAALYHLPVEIPLPATTVASSLAAQITVLLEEKVPVVSFTFGVLPDDAIQALHNNGCILIGTATCVAEAKLLEQKGIDIVTAQGMEAGGHRATFVTSNQMPLIGSLSLIPLMANSIRTPLLAAGGIMDGHSIKAALTAGASGVQLGSAFIAAEESMAIPAYKAAVQRATDTDTVLTRSFTGRWARGLANTFINTLDQSGLAIPAYPVQIALTAAIRAWAIEHNNEQWLPMWAGQSAGKARPGKTADIFKTLLAATGHAA